MEGRAGEVGELGGEAEDWGRLVGASGLISHQAGFPGQAAERHCQAPILSSQPRLMAAGAEQDPSVSRLSS